MTNHDTPVEPVPADPDPQPIIPEPAPSPDQPVVPNPDARRGVDALRSQVRV